MANVSDVKMLYDELKHMTSTLSTHNSNKLNGEPDEEFDETIMDEICAPTESKSDQKYYIVLDLETTKYRDIIQVAYTIYDESFNALKKVDNLVNEGIGKVDYYQKFTLEDIYTHGKHPYEVLDELRNDMMFGTHLVCHNISFDAKLIYKYFDTYNIHLSKRPIEICTMKLSKTMCDFKDVRGRIKAPKLSELYVFCFNEEPDENKTHTADYDIAITAKCFQYLMTNDFIDISKCK